MAEAGPSILRTHSALSLTCGSEGQRPCGDRLRCLKVVLIGHVLQVLHVQNGKINLERHESALCLPKHNKLLPTQAYRLVLWIV